MKRKANQLLGAHEPDCQQRLEGELEAVDVKLKHVICEAEANLDHACFPQGAMHSIQASPASTRPSPLPSVRTLLLGLVLICLVPGLLGVGFLMYRTYEDGRLQAEKNSIQTARAMVKVVDGKLDAARVVATALAGSQFVASADWAGFHRRASDLLKSEGIGTQAVVTDATGQHLVNTGVAWGTPLKVSTLPEVVRRVFETGKPVVTPLFVGTMSGKPRFSVLVPARSGTEVVYAVSVAMGTDSLERMLLEQRLPADWISSVTDNVGNIVARTLNTEKFVGQPVNPEISTRLLTAPEAAFESVTKEGVPALLVYSRSPVSGWTVAIAIPLASLQADLKRNLMFLGFGALLLFATSVWFAHRLAARVAGSVQALTGSAKALASGDALQVSEPGFREADEAGMAMARTSELLSQRAQALLDSNAALRARERELEHSLQRVTQAAKAGGVGLWEWDLNTNEVFFSDEWKQLLGHAPDEIADEFEEWQSRVHPDDLQPTLAAVRASVEDPRRPYNVTVRMKQKDGAYRWFIGQASVLIDEAGRPYRMLGSQIDITDRRQAEDVRLNAQRLEAENRQILEASRLKSQFLANMSHELRTPLNAVIGFADLLHSGFIKPDSPKHQEFLGHIGTSGRHLLQLINDVLDLSKVESGKFDFFPEHIDLPVLLKEVQDVLHTAVSRKNIRISTDIDADLIDLTLDPARLKQVLYNYLSNAIKFTAAGGHVMVRAMAEGPEHFRIEVKDTGIGISAADLPRLFTEFQQLDAGYSKQHQGTGLGLALTRRLVQAQGGQVGVRSTLGVGSVFYAVLNRTDGRDMQRAEGIASGMLEREADRVLVIEDDLGDQALLIAALSQAGFAVDAAADSPNALLRARETAYAALTLDLNLPSRRGLELLNDIRSRGASHASPVLSVAMPADLNNSAAFVIANVLCKPIRSDEIVSAMARFRVPGALRATVMVIDDEEVSLDLMQATLKSIGIDAVCFQDGRVALQEIDRHQPGAIVLDLMMPSFDGFQVLDALQRLPAWREVPVFIWTSMLLTDEEYATLARSARAILIKGGGAMETVLESVRRWRQPVVAGAGPKP